MNFLGTEAAVENYKACYKSINQLSKISKTIGSDCGFAKKKSLYFAAFKKDVPDLKKELQARKENGFPVKWLSPASIEKAFGIVKTHGGILYDQDGSIDAFRWPTTS